MTTVLEHLRTLHPPGGLPLEVDEVFDVPVRLLGARDLRPGELLETDYEAILVRIMRQVLAWEPDHRPQMIATLAHAHLAHPGAWRVVAECCKSFAFVQMPDGAAKPDLFCLTLGLATDLVRALWVNDVETLPDAAEATLASLYGLRTETLAMPVFEASVPLPCHPEPPVAVRVDPSFVVQETHLTCRCGTPWVVVREATLLPSKAGDSREDLFTVIHKEQWVTP